MIEKGDLYQSGVEFNGELILVQVQRTYDKADIDPECPESVAIIGMVEAVVLSGKDIGKTYRYQRRSFRNRFSKVEEAS